MPINPVQHTWIQRILELRPSQRITQVLNFVWLMIGIYKNRSVHLSKIAGKISGPAKALSTTRRLSRFLDNPVIQAGLRHLVDRHDRRDLSIFQIGFRYLQRRSINALPFQTSLCTYL